MHVFESRLERDCQMLFDVDHGVRFSAQPETFRWWECGRTRRWTPDLRLESMADGALVFVEVKPSKVVARCPDLRGRLQGMIDQCAARGAAFALLTERDIRGQALAVARRIRCAADRCDPDTTGMLLDVLSPVRLPQPLGALERLFARPADRFALLGLLGRGLLGFDPARGIWPDTVISEGRHPWR